MTALTMLALLVVVIVPAWLVFAQWYEDGLWGRLALAAMSTAASAELLLLVDGRPTLGAPGMLLVVGTAAFLTRHAYRAWSFHSRPRGAEEDQSSNDDVAFSRHTDDPEKWRQA